MESEIQPINSLLYFNTYLNQEKPTKTHLMVLALDFDQTLVEAKTYFGSEKWYKFLDHSLNKQDFKPHTHFKWAMHLAKDVPYNSCESIEKIHTLIQEFRAQGWAVVILTARPDSIVEATLQHIHQAGLSFSAENVIFKDPSGAKKRDCLQAWLKKQPGWEDIKDLTLLFADDTISNCENVANIAEVIDRKVKVESFHFCGATATHEINNHQLKNLAVQLAAYRIGDILPSGSRGYR